MNENLPVCFTNGMLNSDFDGDYVSLTTWVERKKYLKVKTTVTTTKKHVIHNEYLLVSKIFKNDNRKPKRYEVHRKFKDFEYIREYLFQHYPGSIVSAIRNETTDELETFVYSVLVHPFLAHDHVFQDFFKKGEKFKHLITNKKPCPASNWWQVMIKNVKGCLKHEWIPCFEAILSELEIMISSLRDMKYDIIVHIDALRSMSSSYRKLSASFKATAMHEGRIRSLANGVTSQLDDSLCRLSKDIARQSSSQSDIIEATTLNLEGVIKNINVEKSIVRGVKECIIMTKELIDKWNHTTSFSLSPSIKKQQKLEELASIATRQAKAAVLEYDRFKHERVDRIKAMIHVIQINQIDSAKLALNSLASPTGDFRNNAAPNAYHVSDGAQHDHVSDDKSSIIVDSIKVGRSHRRLSSLASIASIVSNSDGVSLNQHHQPFSSVIEGWLWKMEQHKIDPITERQKWTQLYYLLPLHSSTLYSFVDNIAARMFFEKSSSALPLSIINLKQVNLEQVTQIDSFGDKKRCIKIIPKNASGEQVVLSPGHDATGHASVHDYDVWLNCLENYSDYNAIQASQCESASVSSAELIDNVPQSSQLVALYDYTPMYDDELEMKKGQVFNVVKQISENWFRVSRANDCYITGVVPANHVKVLDYSRTVSVPNSAKLKGRRAKTYSFESIGDRSRKSSIFSDSS